MRNMGRLRNAKEISRMNFSGSRFRLLHSYYSQLCPVTVKLFTNLPEELLTHEVKARAPISKLLSQ